MNNVHVCHNATADSNIQCKQLQPTQHILQPMYNLTCWSHNDVDNHFDDVLCSDNKFMSLYVPVAINFTTTDCSTKSYTNSYTNTVSRAYRKKCPPSSPYMCKLRHQSSTDFWCAKTVAECEPLGGVRSCAWVQHDLVTLPTIEEVSYDPDNPAITTFHRENEESRMAIDSVSMCGTSRFLQDATKNVVVFLDETIGFTDVLNCPTGFMCCLQDYQTNDDCECPEIATKTQLQVYDGAFADTCYSQVKQWPLCVHECAEMGDQCQYYMVNQENKDCLLCCSAQHHIRCLRHYWYE